MFMNRPTPASPLAIVNDCLVLEQYQDLRDLHTVAEHYIATARDRDGGATVRGARALSEHLAGRLSDDGAEQHRPTATRPIGPLDADDLGLLQRIGAWYVQQTGGSTPASAYAARLALIRS